MQNPRCPRSQPRTVKSLRTLALWNKNAKIRLWENYATVPRSHLHRPFCLHEFSKKQQKFALKSKNNFYCNWLFSKVSQNKKQQNSNSNFRNKVHHNFDRFTKTNRPMNWQRVGNRSPKATQHTNKHLSYPRIDAALHFKCSIRGWNPQRQIMKMVIRQKATSGTGNRSQAPQFHTATGMWQHLCGNNTL